MAGTTSYYHCDASGNVRALTDSSQNVTDRYTYDAFGNTVAQSGTTENNFRFGGQVGYHLNPDSGSYYVRQREYQPVIIRWTSVDPIGFRGDGYDLYLYALNSPVSMIDPSGLKEESPSCKCEDVLKVFLADWRKTPIGKRYPDIVRSVMQCNPNIFCSENCGGLDGQTFLDGDKFIHVCLPLTASTEQYFYGLLLHELIHVGQFRQPGVGGKCNSPKGRPTVPELQDSDIRCTVCKERENEAYRLQARFLFRDLKDRDEFIKWGICKSCWHACPDLRKNPCPEAPRNRPMKPFP